MSARPDQSERLLELERMLAQSRTGLLATGPENTDPVSLLLAGVPVERIRQFTTGLQTSGEAGTDEILAVTMRLLLNDYMVAVGHLRAAARLAGARIDAAASPIRECRKFLQEHDPTPAS